jgi:hypothetical protein
MAAAPPIHLRSRATSRAGTACLEMPAMISPNSAGGAQRVSRRSAELAQFCANRLVRRETEAPSVKKFPVPRRSPKGASRHRRGRPMAMRKRDHANAREKKHLFSASDLRASVGCTSHGQDARGSSRRADRRRWRRRWKKICARVLTVKKTVIRFRPSRRCLPKRVSRINTTTRSTTRASARNLQSVEQARFPQRKAANPRSTARAAAPRGSSRIRIDVRIAPTDSPRRTPPRVFATGRYQPVVH